MQVKNNFNLSIVDMTPNDQLLLYFLHLTEIVIVLLLKETFISTFKQENIRKLICVTKVN